MSIVQSEREYLDEIYNRLSSCVRNAGARACSDSEIQAALKDAETAWKEYSTVAMRVEGMFSKFERVLRRKGLLI